MAKGGQELVFCSLGGAGEIGMNLNLFGYGKPGERSEEHTSELQSH